MSERIFISYASGDLEDEPNMKLFDTFCNELISEVAGELAVSSAQLAFRAKHSIQSGQD